jgi:hypothetical protein
MQHDCRLVRASQVGKCDARVGAIVDVSAAWRAHFRDSGSLVAILLIYGTTRVLLASHAEARRSTWRASLTSS